MAIVQARNGRITISDAQNSAPLAVFDYSIPLHTSRAVEAAIYTDALDFVWGSIPQLLADANVFALQLEEALLGSKDFVPVYCREPLPPLQLVHVVLKLRASAMQQVGLPSIAVACVERMLREFIH